jgi:hypothetical protein
MTEVPKRSDSSSTGSPAFRPMRTRKGVPGPSLREATAFWISIAHSRPAPADVNEGGYLVIEKPWPGMLTGMYGDPENRRMKEVYFSRFPGRYFTGDGARVDGDGDYWLMGGSTTFERERPPLGTAAKRPRVAPRWPSGGVISHEIKATASAYVVLAEDIAGRGSRNPRNTFVRWARSQN